MVLINRFTSVTLSSSPISISFADSSFSLGRCRFPTVYFPNSRFLRRMFRSFSYTSRISVCTCM